MQNHMEFSKKTWRYTMVDPYGNLSTIERNIPPTTVSWEYICRDYHFGAESREKAEALMVKHFEAHSPYRGFCQIAKHLGYTLVSVDTEGTAISGVAMPRRVLLWARKNNKLLAWGSLQASLKKGDSL